MIPRVFCYLNDRVLADFEAALDGGHEERRRETVRRAGKGGLEGSVGGPGARIGGGRAREHEEVTEREVATSTAARFHRLMEHLQGQQVLKSHEVLDSKTLDNLEKASIVEVSGQPAIPQIETLLGAVGDMKEMVKLAKAFGAIDDEALQAIEAAHGLQKVLESRPLRLTLRTPSEGPWVVMDLDRTNVLDFPMLSSTDLTVMGKVLRIVGEEETIQAGGLFDSLRSAPEIGPEVETALSTAVSTGELPEVFSGKELTGPGLIILPVALYQ